MSSTSLEVDDQAARWAALRDLGELSPEQQEEFNHWLSADKRHLGAYARAEGTLVRVDRGHAAAVSGSATLQPTQVSKWGRRRVVLTGAAAASVAIAGFTATQIWKSGREQVFATDIGQLREVLLAD